jgi:hypothetical protein
VNKEISTNYKQLQNTKKNNEPRKTSVEATGGMGEEVSQTQTLTATC